MGVLYNRLVEFCQAWVAMVIEDEDGLDHVLLRFIYGVFFFGGFLFWWFCGGWLFLCSCSSPEFVVEWFG